MLQHSRLVSNAGLAFIALVQYLPFLFVPSLTFVAAVAAAVFRSVIWRFDL